MSLSQDPDVDNSRFIRLVPPAGKKHRAFLARLVEEGPIPAVHGVVRWRACDLIMRLYEEFRLPASHNTNLPRCRIGLQLRCDPPKPSLHGHYSRFITTDGGAVRPSPAHRYRLVRMPVGQKNMSLFAGPVRFSRAVQIA